MKKSIMDDKGTTQQKLLMKLKSVLDKYKEDH